MRGSKWSPGQILGHHTWTAPHGEALEAFPWKKRVSSCVCDIASEKLALSDFWCSTALPQVHMLPSVDLQKLQSPISNIHFPLRLWHHGAASKSKTASFLFALPHAAKLASIAGIPESVPAPVFLAYGGSLSTSIRSYFFSCAPVWFDNFDNLFMVVGSCKY